MLGSSFVAEFEKLAYSDSLLAATLAPGEDSPEIADAVMKGFRKASPSVKGLTRTIRDKR